MSTHILLKTFERLFFNWANLLAHLLKFLVQYISSQLEMEKPCWVRTLVTQITLYFALYFAFQLGQPQNSVLMIEVRVNLLTCIL